MYEAHLFCDMRRSGYLLDVGQALSIHDDF
jgi:hypothetical protein